MTAASNRFESYSAAARELLGAASIRTKILGIVLALTIVLGLGITWQVRTVMHAVLLDELDSRGTSVVSDLAARSVDPILLNDTFALHQLLVETVGNHPDIVYAFVVDPDGRVIAHSFGDEGFPTGLLSLPATDDRVVYDTTDGRMHDFSAAIFDAQAGTAHVGMSETRLHNVIDGVTGQMLLTTLVVALFGVGAAIFLTWILTRPILDLVGTTNQVGSGDLGRGPSFGPRTRSACLPKRSTQWSRISRRARQRSQRRRQHVPGFSNSSSLPRRRRESGSPGNSTMASVRP